MRRGRIVRLVLWILLGTALRFAALDGDGLWCDEGYTAWVAHLPPEAAREAQRHDDAPPLYYVLQRAVIPRLPPGETSVRLVSAAAGVAGIVWMAACPPFLAAREAATAFAALGVYGVFYGRQARSYSLLILWAMILLTSTARVLDGKRRWLVGVALAEAAALWTHNVSPTLVAGANLGWLLAGRRDARGWLAAQGAALLLWLPALLASLPQLSVHAELNAWIADAWKGTPLAAAPLLSLAGFASAARAWGIPPEPLWSYAGPGAAVLAMASFAAVAILLVAALRGGEAREGRLAASFALTPLVLLAALSMVSAPSYILGRTDAVAYAGFLAWAAIGLGRLPRLFRAVVCVILAAGVLLAVLSDLPVAGRERAGDRRAGTRLREAARPGDWVAYTSLTRPSVDYYLSAGRPGLARDGIARLQFPASSGANPAAVYPVPGDSLRAWEREARAVRERFEKAARDPETAFFIVAPIRRGVSAPAPNAGDLQYPASVLAYTLQGIGELEAVHRGPGDQMNAEWIVVRIRAGALVAIEELQPIEAVP